MTAVDVTALVRLEPLGAGAAVALVAVRVTVAAAAVTSPSVLLVRDTFSPAVG
jgi:hypothetical protein